jgi:hypothetical protein
MKAILKPQHLQLFNPEFHTAIGGKSIRISRDEMTRNWHKYIYSPAAFLFENLTKLRETFKRSKGTVSEAVVLDMSAAKQRGIAFSQPTKKQAFEKKLAAFEKKQKRNRSRLQVRHDQQKQREKDIQAKAKKSANEKAKREAKKATATK